MEDEEILKADFLKQIDVIDLRGKKVYFYFFARISKSKYSISKTMQLV